MKLAWFRADTPQSTHPLDDTAALIAELRSTHDIEVFTAANANDFAWKNSRTPYDLSVHELDNIPAYAFIWPYLLDYGGVLLLRTLILHDSRAAALLRDERMQDYVAEFVFNQGLPSSGQPPAVPHPYQGRWPMLRVPLLASRLTIVSHASAAEALTEQYPEARVRVAHTGVQGVQEIHRVHVDPEAPMILGAIPTDRLDVIHRALARARQAGAEADLMVDLSPERVLQEAQVILSLPWPWFGGPQTPALAAMAAGKTVVVLDTADTADWPTLDPQTWRSRGLHAADPIAVSIDPRDEEHSLAMALQRLSMDAAMRARLGGRAHEWWRAHATPRHAAEDWERILAEAAQLQPPARPADWPAHL